MRTLIVVLAGCAFLTVSAYAGDKQASRSAQSNVDKTAVAVVTPNQVQVARAAATLTSKRTKADAGDSRLNDYRLERESCCGPML
jgi:hypothetical protein